ncbi:MAG: glycosyltransferase [Candidatus Bathyarchaeota archaeon]|nr:glycosyltransferase [Candidatus Bathyarchaeota archaeon]
MGETIEVSLIVPAYNEVTGLERAIATADAEVSNIAASYEIIVAEDGSSDGTNELARRLSETNRTVRHLHNDERLGRGKALTRAFWESRGAILAYMDVDLSTDMSSLRPLIDSIREGWDICTGSRMIQGSLVKRSMTRKLSSWTYNQMIRILFDTGVHDHQCGFKAFNRRSLFAILGEVEDTHWFWDTEVLAVASHRGYMIREIPVTWVEDQGTTVDLFKDSAKMCFKAFILRVRLARD